MERMYWVGTALLIMLVYIYFNYTANSVCPLNIHEFKSEKPEYAGLSAIDQRGIIIDAVKRMRSISEGDYEMICKYGNDITVLPDDLQKEECGNQEAEACYYHAISNNTIILSGSSLSDGIMSYPLTYILVHEACHGMRIQEYGDKSEQVCVDMGVAYLTKEMEGAEYKVACRVVSEKTIVVGNATKTLVEGVCNFVNKGNSKIHNCTVVSPYCCIKSTKSCELENIDTKVCADVEPGGNSSEAFNIEVNKTCDWVNFAWSYG